MQPDLAAALDRRWLKVVGPPAVSGALRLLCFHHAGGSAASFRHWPALLPVGVEAVAVQLPGRADRFNEPPHERMGSLVEELVEAIDPLLDQPFACYGVSMGARVQWALAHELRARGLPGPRALFVACDPAPASDTGPKLWEGRFDDLGSYVREMGGTPQEVLDEPLLMAALLPVLRADLTVLSTHDLCPALPLDVPVHAFGGRDDPEATPQRMAGWQQETSTHFRLDVVAGGHFFDADAEAWVAEEVGGRAEALR